MKAVLQRVNNASVKIDKEIVGIINNGLLIYLGIGKDDQINDVDILIEKIAKMRIFEDESNKLNLSIKDIDGEVMVISQFTLYADCKKGTRPNFFSAAAPSIAEDLYNHFICQLKLKEINVSSGVFGAYMDVQSVNTGPVTILLDTKD